MPQPLSKVRTNASLNMEPQAIASNLYLASLIAHVINSCSYLESHLGDCLAELLKSRPGMGVAIYSSLTSTATRLAVLNAMIDSSDLPKRDKQLLFAIVMVAAKAVSRRNDVAHGMWASSPDVADALILVPTDVHLDVWGRILNALRLGKRVKTFKLPLFDRSKIMVYREKDFEEIGDQLINATNYLKRFWKMRRTVLASRVQLRRSLSSEPDVQIALRQIRKDRKKKQAVHR